MEQSITRLGIDLAKTVFHALESRPPFSPMSHWTRLRIRRRPALVYDDGACLLPA